MNNQALLWLSVLGLAVLLLIRPKRANAKALIKQFEGFSLVPYVDESGLEHIGYGHLMKSGEQFESITRGEAEWLLDADVADAARCVDGLVSSDVYLTPNQRAALISFVYNVGCGAFKSSTLLRLLNAGDLTGAADEFLRWNKAGGAVVQGLVDRRFIERNVFLGVG